MSKRRIYIDCSATVYSGANTGIQRVVRNVVKWSSQLKNSDELEIIPVVVLFSNVFYIKPEFVQINKSKLISFGSQAKLTVESTRVKIRNKLSKYRYFGWMFVSFFEFWDRLLRFAYKILKYSRVLSFVVLSGSHRYRPKRDDTFLFLDSFWLLDLPSLFARSLQECGSIQTVIYDIIPLRHPEIVEIVGCRNFSRSFHFLMNKVNKILTISKSVATDVKSYLLSQKYSLDGIEIKHFYLGADFKKKSGSEIHPSIELKNMFKDDGSSVWLMVGTIEPRKNHITVIEAFDKLWKQGIKLKLVIVGRIGWKCEETLDRIQNNPMFGKSLIYLKDCADEDLQYCYQNASGLIFASISEGFGLPLVEAIYFNVPVVCSDIPVFREVGGDYPCYFNPLSANDLAEKIQKFPLKVSVENKNNLQILTWQESTSQLFDQVIL